VSAVESYVQFAKSRLRGPYRYARTRYTRWRFGFGRGELDAAIRSVGIVPGDTLFLHSGMTGFEGFHGTVAEIINAFEEAVGPEGVLLMPTFSMSGTAVDFARSGRIFDPRRTPSQMGLITEAFRRSPGVVRGVGDRP
jgi:aminoglycoside 3-N-acetyltransferase